MVDCPCIECGKRKVTLEYNCHSNCPDYANYRAELARQKEYNDGGDTAYLNYYINNIRKKRKRKNEKNRI